MARITDRRLFLDEQRFFFRNLGGLGLPARGAEAGGHALQSDGGASFRATQVALLPAVEHRASRLSDGFLSDRRMKSTFRWLACPMAMAST